MPSYQIDQYEHKPVYYSVNLKTEDTELTLKQDVSSYGESPSIDVLGDLIHQALLGLGYQRKTIKELFKELSKL